MMLLKYLVFLSRLCGGEEYMQEPAPLDGFLSRLCGGEAINITNDGLLNFLSRLCGGEERIFLRGM